MVNDRDPSPDEMERTAHSELLYRADRAAREAKLRGELMTLVRLSLVTGRLMSPGSPAVLRHAVINYVAHVKADGAPPERALALLESAIAEAAVKEGKLEESSLLARDAFSWCIEFFYGGMSKLRDP
jgi:hypothetical protein